MIIWNGLGFLVGVVTFGCLLATEAGVEWVFKDDTFYQKHGWPKLVGMTVAALLVWVLARILSRRPGRVLMDPATGERVRIGRDHSFFFIPVKYWPPILLILGFAFSFTID
jgi:hypothetical protein